MFFLSYCRASGRNHRGFCRRTSALAYKLSVFTPNQKQRYKDDNRKEQKLALAAVHGMRVPPIFARAIEFIRRVDYESGAY